MSSYSSEDEIYDVYATCSDTYDESQSDEYPCFSKETAEMYKLFPNLDVSSDSEEYIERKDIKKAGKFFNNGIHFMNNKNFIDSAESFRVAGIIYSKLSKWDKAFYSYSYCGKMFCKSGKTNQAIHAFQSARIIAENNGIDMIELYIEMGDIWTHANLPKTAKRCFSNALHLLKENGTQKEINMILERLGQVS